MDRTWAVVSAVIFLSLLKLSALAFLGWLIWRADDSQLPDDDGGSPPSDSFYRPPGPQDTWLRASKSSRRPVSAGRSGSSPG